MPEGCATSPTLLACILAAMERDRVPVTVLRPGALGVGALNTRTMLMFRSQEPGTIAGKRGARLPGGAPLTGDAGDVLVPHVVSRGARHKDDGNVLGTAGPAS